MKKKRKMRGEEADRGQSIRPRQSDRGEGRKKRLAALNT